MRRSDLNRCYDQSLSMKLWHRMSHLSAEPFQTDHTGWKVKQTEITGPDSCSVERFVLYSTLCADKKGKKFLFIYNHLCDTQL